jgi:hypothetical protein
MCGHRNMQHTSCTHRMCALQHAAHFLHPQHGILATYVQHLQLSSIQCVYGLMALIRVHTRAAAAAAAQLFVLCD